MLYEIRYVRQREGEPHCRWFTDDYWDLFVWADSPEDIVGFQLCYGKPNNERAIDWHANKGYRHAGVSQASSGRIGPSTETPILVQDGEFAAETVSAKFLEDSKNIDATVRRFVYEKISGYSDGDSNS